MEEEEARKHGYRCPKCGTPMGEVRGSYYCPTCTIVSAETIASAA